METLDKMKRDFYTFSRQFYQLMINHFFIVYSYNRFCSFKFRQQWSPNEKNTARQARYSFNMFEKKRTNIFEQTIGFKLREFSDTLAEFQEQSICNDDLEWSYE